MKHQGMFTLFTLFAPPHQCWFRSWPLDIFVLKPTVTLFQNLSHPRPRLTHWYQRHTYYRASVCRCCAENLIRSVSTVVAEVILQVCLRSWQLVWSLVADAGTVVSACCRCRQSWVINVHIVRVCFSFKAPQGYTEVVCHAINLCPLFTASALCKCVRVCVYFSPALSFCLFACPSSMTMTPAVYCSDDREVVPHLFFITRRFSLTFKLALLNVKLALPSKTNGLMLESACSNEK